MPSRVLPGRAIPSIQDREVIGEEEPFKSTAPRVCRGAVPESGVRVAVHGEPERELPLLREGDYLLERRRDVCL